MQGVSCINVPFGFSIKEDIVACRSPISRTDRSNDKMSGPLERFQCNRKAFSFFTTKTICGEILLEKVVRCAFVVGSERDKSLR